MSATTARDALADEMATDHPVPCWPHEAIETMVANPDLVLAALIESGWRPTDDQLRAMGLELRTDYEHVSTWRFPKGATDGE